jgi:hypothetical protein
VSETTLKDRAELLVPQFARDNYDQKARDNAVRDGVTPKEAFAELVDEWKRQHELHPLDGYDLLAAWGEDHDPGDGPPDTSAAAALNRAVESAKREPGQNLQAEPEVVDAAETALAERVTPDDEPVEKPKRKSGKGSGAKAK